MLTVIVVLKALMEVAGLALLGQGVLYVLAGDGREHNVFYRVIRSVTAPVVRLARFVTPRVIPDDRVGLVAFALVAGMWVALTAIKIKLVLEQAGAATP
jgi:hypothetical protein